MSNIFNESSLPPYSPAAELALSVELPSILMEEFCSAKIAPPKTVKTARKKQSFKLSKSIPAEGSNAFHLVYHDQTYVNPVPLALK